MSAVFFIFDPAAMITIFLVSRFQQHILGVLLQMILVDGSPLELDAKGHVLECGSVFALENQKLALCRFVLRVHR